jgi:hypothetical protein
MVDVKIGLLSIIDIYSGGGFKVDHSKGVFSVVNASHQQSRPPETNKRKKASQNAACLCF